MKRMMINPKSIPSSDISSDIMYPPILKIQLIKMSIKHENVNTRMM